MTDNAFDKWAAFYSKAISEGSELMWPSETLVRLFKGSYVPGLTKNYQGRNVIEVGFGNGNNLIFLASLGLSLSGTEVDDKICQTVQSKMNRLGYEADLRVGDNRHLPFSDNRFDFLLSWNVIHYENNEEAINEAIAEYHRVLKPGGRFFLSTAGPEDSILNNSITLGTHRYQIGHPDDFRQGQVFFYFDAPNYIQYYFAKRFSELLVGRTHDFLFTKTADSFIVTGIKQ